MTPTHVASAADAVTRAASPYRLKLVAAMPGAGETWELWRGDMLLCRGERVKMVHLYNLSVDGWLSKQV